MRRAAICGAIAVALVAAAVAVGAGTDVRIHRLHVPPPPVGDDSGTSVPPAPGKPNPTNPTDPSVPGTSPPAAPPPAGAQPPPPPASSRRSAAASRATLRRQCRGERSSDYAIDPIRDLEFSLAPTLTFRGTYPAASGDIAQSWRSSARTRPGCAARTTSRRPGRARSRSRTCRRQLRSSCARSTPPSDDQGLHRQLTARGVRRRARGRRHAAVARASSRRATRRSWPRPRARRRRDGGR